MSEPIPPKFYSGNPRSFITVVSNIYYHRAGARVTEGYDERFEYTPAEDIDSYKRTKESLIGTDWKLINTYWVEKPGLLLIKCLTGNVELGIRNGDTFIPLFYLESSKTIRLTNLLTSLYIRNTVSNPSTASGSTLSAPVSYIEIVALP